MKDKKQVIEITDHRLNLLQQMSSNFHGVYAETMHGYGEKEVKLIENTLGFGYKIIQVVGLVAGFGFTALGSVRTVNLFILGEFFFDEFNYLRCIPNKKNLHYKSRGYSKLKEPNKRHFRREEPTFSRYN